MKAIVKVGAGRSRTGKILDRETCFYLIDTKNNIDEREHALEYHHQTGKYMYISVNGKAYTRITEEELRKLC